LTGVPQVPTLHGVQERWTVAIRRPKDHDGPIPYVPYGPAGDRLPAQFTAEVEYKERPLRVTIDATFDGVGRVKARVVAVDRTDGESVTPQDMAATQLGAVMSSVVWKATRRPGGGTIMQGGRRDASGPLTDDELLTLARMYWFEYVSWGRPRQAVMNLLELPRSTANYWIRKAREKYGLPGQHAEGDADGQHQAP
jgi:hypothetical protein